MDVAVRQDVEKDTMKDWGAFVGSLSGYVAAEGTEVEIGSLVQRYVSYVFFKTHPVASADQVDEIVKALCK